MEIQVEWMSSLIQISGCPLFQTLLSAVVNKCPQPLTAPCPAGVYCVQHVPLFTANLLRYLHALICMKSMHRKEAEVSSRMISHLSGLCGAHTLLWRALTSTVALTGSLYIADTLGLQMRERKPGRQKLSSNNLLTTRPQQG